MASVLYQSIEALSRDKGIEPEIVVGAVEDAIALATRKFYKTQENMRAEMDKETGEIRAYVYKTVVEGPEQVEDEINQLTLDAARALAPEVEVGGELRFYKDTTPLGRIAAQMAKQVIFQKVREAERDTVFLEYNHRAGEVSERDGEAAGADGRDLRPGQGGGANAQARAEPAGAVCRGRAGARGAAAGGPRGQGAAGDCEPRGAGAGAEPLPERGAGDLRRHGLDQGDCARGGRADQDRGAEPRQGRGPGGRLRGHEGDARAVHHPRAEGREDRHHRVLRGDHNVCREGAAAGQGEQSFDHQPGGEADRGDRRRYAAFACHRQKRTERPAGGQAAGLEDRHQERGGEAPGGRAADAGDGRRRDDSGGADQASWATRSWRS